MFWRVFCEKTGVMVMQARFFALLDCCIAAAQSIPKNRDGNLNALWFFDWCKNDCCWKHLRPWHTMTMSWILIRLISSIMLVYKLHVHCLCLTMGCTADILNFDLMMMVMKYGVLGCPTFIQTQILHLHTVTPKQEYFVEYWTPQLIGHQHSWQTPKIIDGDSTHMHCYGQCGSVQLLVCSSLQL